MTRKIFIEAVNLVLLALLIFPLLIFIERLTANSSQLYSFVQISYPLLLCYFCGHFSRRYGSTVSIILFFASCILSLGSMVLLTGGLSLYIEFSIISAVICYLIGINIRDYFPASFCVSGLILYFVTLLIYPSIFDMGDMTLPNICAVTFLVLSMFSFNSQGMRLAMHNTGSGYTRIPIGLMSKNIILTLCFILICIVISLVSPLKYILILPLRGIAAVWNAIKALLQKNSSEVSYGEVTVEESAGLSGLDLGGSEHVEAAWVMNLVYALACLICLAVLLFLIWKLIKAAGRAGGFFGQLASKFSSLFSSRDDEEYDDSVESLFDFDSFLKERGEAIGAFINKLRRHEPGFDDMPDAASKVRFVFKSILKSAIMKESNAAAKTPSELMLNRGDNFDKLSENYNIVRYSRHEVGSDAAENAGCVLKEIK